MSQALIWAAGGTGFTFLMTTLGAAMVFLFRGEINMKIQRVFLGFAAGVMIAASVWSLLIPAINEAEKAGGIGWIPAAGGFVLGILFLLLMDQLLPHLHAGSSEPEGMTSSWKRTTLLVMAVTLHNIPEGMAVGLAFAMAAQNMGMEAGAAAAFALAWVSVSRTSPKARQYHCLCARKESLPGKPFCMVAFQVLWSRFSEFLLCLWPEESSR